MKVYHPIQVAPVSTITSRLQSIYTAKDVDNFKKTHQIQEQPVQKQSFIKTDPFNSPAQHQRVSSTLNNYHPHQGIYDAEVQPNRKFNCNQREKSDPFAAQVYQVKSKHDRNKSDLFSADNLPPKVKNYKNAQTTEQEQYRRVMASPRDLENRAGVTTAMENRQIIKKIIPQKQSEEQQFNFQSKKHIPEPHVEQKDHVRVKNVEFQKSDLWSGRQFNDVPHKNTKYIAPNSALDFGIEKVQKSSTIQNKSNISNYDTIKHKFPETKFDCKNPNSVDGRKLLFNQSDATAARREAYEQMLQNKNKMQ